jgi:hypothetical protein
MSHVARVNFVVEGPTEETFVNNLLMQALASCGVYIAARSVETGRQGGHIYRGGMTSYAKARGDIQRWLSGDRSAYVTTMFDLYALPSDFPNFDDSKKIPNPYQKVKSLEEGLAADIQDPRFVPYIQLYEFEGLLFSDVRVVDSVLGIYSNSQLAELEKIRSQFGTPEEINDDPTSAPSKRLIKLYPGYDKIAYGSRIAQRIGLDTMRKKCPHFGEWVLKLESLGSS